MLDNGTHACSTYTCCPPYITCPDPGCRARLMHVACMTHMHLTAREDCHSLHCWWCYTPNRTPPQISNVRPRAPHDQPHCAQITEPQRQRGIHRAMNDVHNGRQRSVGRMQPQRPHGNVRRWWCQLCACTWQSRARLQTRSSFKSPHVEFFMLTATLPPDVLWSDS